MRIKKMRIKLVHVMLAILPIAVLTRLGQVAMDAFLARQEWQREMERRRLFQESLEKAARANPIHFPTHEDTKARIRILSEELERRRRFRSGPTDPGDGREAGRGGDEISPPRATPTPPGR